MECRTTISSNREAIHPAGKLLEQKGKQLKRALGSPWNWPGSQGPLPPRLSNRNRAAKTQTIWATEKTLRGFWDQPAAWEQQKPAELSRRSLDYSHMKRTLSNLLSWLHPVQHTLGFRLLWTVTHAEVGLRMQLWVTSCPVSNLPTHSPIKLICSPTWDFGGMCTLVCHEFLIWGEYICVLCLTKKSSITQQKGNMVRVGSTCLPWHICSQILVVPDVWRITAT